MSEADLHAPSAILCLSNSNLYLASSFTRINTGSCCIVRRSLITAYNRVDGSHKDNASTIDRQMDGWEVTAKRLASLQKRDWLVKVLSLRHRLHLYWKAVRKKKKTLQGWAMFLPVPFKWNWRHATKAASKQAIYHRRDMQCLFCRKIHLPACSQSSSACKLSCTRYIHTYIHG